MCRAMQALRQVAGQYAYDNDNNEPTLRSNADEINEQLEQKLDERLTLAGIEVVEARINYLPMLLRLLLLCCAASKPMPSSRLVKRLWKVPFRW